jgi:hypothetical protein
MADSEIRKAFDVGYREAKFKGHKDAILRAVIHGTILGAAIFYPAALWKRIVGALVAFFLVGLIGQYRTVKRARNAPPSGDIDGG